MTIVLDTPEQINAWVLLSRVSQAKLHMKGMPVKGLAKWMKENIPAEFRTGSSSTVKSLFIPLLDWCDSLDIPTKSLTDSMPELHYHVVCAKSAGSNYYFDQGVYATWDEASADWFAEGLAGKAHIFRTWDAVRGAQPKAYRF